MTIHIENVIISVTMITKKLLVTRTPNFALYGVFAFRDIKSCGTLENALQAIYIKFGNTIVRDWWTVPKCLYLYISKGSLC